MLKKTILALVLKNALFALGFLGGLFFNFFGGDRFALDMGLVTTFIIIIAYVFLRMKRKDPAFDKNNRKIVILSGLEFQIFALLQMGLLLPTALINPILFFSFLLYGFFFEEGRRMFNGLKPLFSLN